MTSDALFSFAEHREHEIIHISLAENQSLSLESERCFIALSKGLSGIKEKEYLAHELGHCEYGGFYNRHSSFDIRTKAERRADRWAYHKLLPPGEILSAVRKGAREIWELAELFEVSCEFMQKALEYYRSVITL